MTFLTVSCLLLLLNIANAAVTLTNGRWSTTFNCPDWDQNLSSDTFSCDGLNAQNYLNTCDGQVSHLNSSGNNASGGGGKGFREYICEGQNTYTSTLNVNLSQPVDELWFRWYMRYQSGFSWSTEHYHKLVYFNVTQGTHPGNAYIALIWGASVSLYDQAHAVWHYPDHSTCTGSPSLPFFGWSDIMGGNTGDGKWHYYEMHVKKDTNGSNGVFEFWIDGVLHNSHSDVNWGGYQFSDFGVPSNQNAVGTPGWLDIDDMAISTAGYIGPVGGGGGGGSAPPPQAAPTAPAGLIVK